MAQWPEGVSEGALLEGAASNGACQRGTQWEGRCRPIGASKGNGKKKSGGGCQQEGGRKRIRKGATPSSRNDAGAGVGDWGRTGAGDERRGGRGMGQREGRRRGMSAAGERVGSRRRVS